MEFVSNSLGFLSKRIQAFVRRVSILKVVLKNFYFNFGFRDKKSARVIFPIKKISFT